MSQEPRAGYVWLYKKVNILMITHNTTALVQYSSKVVCI